MNIKLGDRTTGELELQVISHSWEEFPSIVNGRNRTDKKLYLELDKTNFNLLAMFYRNATIGDCAEGLASKVSMYYDLFMIKTQQGAMTKNQFIDLYPNFDEFIDDNIEEYYTYVVVVY